MYQLGNNDSFPFRRSIETFLKSGISQEEAALKLGFHERQRRTQVNIVLEQLAMNSNAYGSTRKLNSALTNLALPHEERVIRSAIRVGGKANLIMGGSLQSSAKKANYTATM